MSEDLATELAAVAPRRWRNRATGFLAAAALLVGGFVGGVQVQQRYGAPPAGTGLPGGVQNRLGAGGAGQGGPGQGLGQGGLGQGGLGSGPGAAGGGTGTGAAGAATVGTVKLVDGTTVYLETASGEVITVRTDGQTKVRDSRASSLRALAPGDRVSVQGSSGGDGTVTATTVTEEPG